MLKYFLYVLKHKYYVFIECIKLGIPWRGITHDLSKFIPSEFFPYARYFGGNIKKGRDKGYYSAGTTTDSNFNYAWFLHQNRNNHHWQYWVMPTDKEPRILPMSDKARKEMLADWIGAGKAQGTLGVEDWYYRNRSKMQLHIDTKQWIEQRVK